MFIIEKSDKAPISIAKTIYLSHWLPASMTSGETKDQKEMGKGNANGPIDLVVEKDKKNRSLDLYEANQFHEFLFSFSFLWIRVAISQRSNPSILTA
jgi:hypothetical protein